MSSRSPSSKDTKTFKYYCAQRKGYDTRIKEQDAAKKQPASNSMERFECAGELSITVNSNVLDAVRVRLIHLPHAYHVDISSKPMNGLGTVDLSASPQTSS
ncbi:hypothetical protein M422DRAFT_68608 [Sphaerobolus stellatus SS14]|uniref:Uncharacterized protein n=1 Tax=Sphaerobolus stellatus (strain SS14) TaxID=990650 RepID=A0A0C9VQ64_SPHS4|nr:hypothetical protein M422DRAFT_68608 [Sphaerobolus stellatus SS14]